MAHGNGKWAVFAKRDMTNDGNTLEMMRVVDWL